MIWFTSDLHFNHANIIKYCDRPFADVEEMNNTLISNINELVKEDDELYVLGDFAFLNRASFESGLEIFNRIQCKNKILIQGNHDEKNVKQLPWKELLFLKELYIDGCTPIVMSHIPIENLSKDYNGKYQRYIHLHGHLHSKTPIQSDTKPIFDVGVDAWNYQPVSLDKILILANMF